MTKDNNIVNRKENPILLNNPKSLQDCQDLSLVSPVNFYAHVCITSSDRLLGILRLTNHVFPPNYSIALMWCNLYTDHNLSNQLLKMANMALDI